MSSGKISIIILSMIALFLFSAAAPAQQQSNPQPPEEIVKLIFIHHSCGENWLADGYGNLGRELAANNYFVSDTNYGWGPDGIGDRTHIPDWMEWFRSAQTDSIMQAVFSESGQNSGYTRANNDPGGENTVVMFKSCFPNSELSGSPNDAAGSYADLSVGGAKYVYNELLQYFASRPDKLFVVVTAPPVSNRANAKNARAFNNWLIHSWLAENTYKLSNVAVFDFYNVLTGKGAHHHFQNGKIEHTTTSSNTLHYPSSDDHPSEKGSQKATDEFIPLLNIYYHTWQASKPQQDLEPESDTGAEVEESAGLEPSLRENSADAALPVPAGLIDDFEGENLSGTNGWEPFWGDTASTSINCGITSEMAHDSSRSLEIDFNVSANDWATCSFLYDTPQDWSTAQGITFLLHASQAGLVFDVDVLTGSSDALQTFQYTVETQQESAQGWAPVSLRWEDFHRVEWEENAGSPFANLESVSGFALGFSTYTDTDNMGTIWVDDLAFQGSDASTGFASFNVEPIESGEAQEIAVEEERRLLPCGMLLILPMMLVGGGIWQRTRR